MIIIGIDPGANGGMCSWSSGIVSIDKCPSSAKKMSMLVSNISKNSRRDFGGKCIAYVEKVWARPSNATRAAFSFGMNYGKWIGVLESNNIDINYVLPNTWMKYWAEKYDIKMIWEDNKTNCVKCNKIPSNIEYKGKSYCTWYCAKKG